MVATLGLWGKNNSLPQCQSRATMCHAWCLGEHLLSSQRPVNFSDSNTVQPATLCHGPHHTFLAFLYRFSFKKRFFSKVKSYELPGEQMATFKSRTFHQGSTWPGVQLHCGMSSQYWWWVGVKARQKVWCLDYLSNFSSFLQNARLSCHGTFTGHYTRESLGKIPLIGRAWDPWHCHVTLFFFLQEEWGLIDCGHVLNKSQGQLKSYILSRVGEHVISSSVLLKAF